jgi:hypothetical protein
MLHGKTDVGRDDVLFFFQEMFEVLVGIKDVLDLDAHFAE